MTDQYAQLDAGLERVIELARAHLGAVKAAQGRIEDDDLWQAYVALNNAIHAYDEQLLAEFGEVTPWTVEPIDPDEADRFFGLAVGGLTGGEPADEHPRVVSVRQRRDYRVPSVSALLRAAEAARRATVQGADEPVAAVESVGEALLELMQASDVSLGALDIPELESLDGVVVVAEVGQPLDPEAFEETDGTGPFALDENDRLVDRLDEHASMGFDDEDEDEDEPAYRGTR
jgi:hypothetical protein